MKNRILVRADLVDDLPMTLSLLLQLELLLLLSGELRLLLAVSCVDSAIAHVLLLHLGVRTLTLVHLRR